VAAVQLRNPVTLLIHVKADDAALWRVDHRELAAYTLGSQRSI
jgi:hypothetical protein